MTEFNNTTNFDEFKAQIFYSPEYDFLRTNSYLGDHLAFLSFSGPITYGIDIPSMQPSIRGCAFNSREYIYTYHDFEQITNIPTGSEIYSFDRLIQLLTNVNPSTIELLGLRQWQFIYMTDIGNEIISNKKLFLSKAAVNALVSEDNIQLCSDHSVNKIYNGGELIKHTYAEMFKDLENTVLDMHDEEHNKIMMKQRISTYMFHFLRLFYTVFELLEDNVFSVYRKYDAVKLHDVYRGKYVTDDGKILPEFYDIISAIENRFTYSYRYSDLIDVPDYQGIRDLYFYINNKVIDGSVFKNKYTTNNIFIR
jgi:predicted nucleotidyltransferase